MKRQLVGAECPQCYASSEPQTRCNTFILRTSEDPEEEVEEKHRVLDPP